MEIVRSDLNYCYVNKYYEKILFAAVLFELGVECAIKFGDAKIVYSSNSLKICADGGGNYHCWIEINDEIIDLNLDVKFEFDLWDRLTRYGHDSVEITEDTNKIILPRSVTFRYNPLTIKNGKKCFGNRYFNSNMTLYKDLKVTSEFISRSKKLAHKYRLSQ